ncbi:hypothetical protein GQ54DRAFT_12117 [Martensiomyces pterosporus]|nr:hypothetical protein GQ54DRAFT_12117 [Martensiomyces pterosporus]
MISPSCRVSSCPFWQRWKQMAGSALRGRQVKGAGASSMCCFVILVGKHETQIHRVRAVGWRKGKHETPGGHWAQGADHIPCPLTPPSRYPLAPDWHRTASKLHPDPR